MGPPYSRFWRPPPHRRPLPAPPARSYCKSRMRGRWRRAKRNSMRPRARLPRNAWRASSPTTNMALPCLRLPTSTVKPDSLQWAVAFWHRATAYQQLEQWEHAAADLGTAEDTFTKAIAAAAGDEAMVGHFTELRQRVRDQRATVLHRMAA